VPGGLHKVGREADDLEAIFAPQGAMEALVAAKQAGRCRFIGSTVHGDPNVVVEMLERSSDWDATLIPLNPADPQYLSFEEIALPAVVQRGMGVQVMKSLGNITDNGRQHQSWALGTGITDNVGYVNALLEGGFDANAEGLGIPPVGCVELYIPDHDKPTYGEELETSLEWLAENLPQLTLS